MINKRALEADLRVGTIFAIYAVPAVIAGLLVLFVVVPEQRA